MPYWIVHRDPPALVPYQDMDVTQVDPAGPLEPDKTLACEPPSDVVAKFPYFPRRWTLGWVDLAKAFPIDPRQPTQNTKYDPTSAVYRVLLAGTPLPYGILPQHLPDDKYFHMEPAPPAHEAERLRIWTEFAADKLSAAGYEPGVNREVDVRLIKAWHIQLRWAFGNSKRAAFPGIKRMEPMWRDWVYDLDEPDHWLFVQRALFWGLTMPQPVVGEGFPPPEYAGPGQVRRCQRHTYKLRDAPPGMIRSYHATSFVALRSILEIGFVSSWDEYRHERGAGPGVYTCQDPWNVHDFAVYHQFVDPRGRN